jgi:hypothetical protein
MIRQYYAPRHRPEPHYPGTIDVGTILYLQDRGRPVYRNPWIVEAWLPRECMGLFMRTGERRRVADWLLLAASDA